MSLWKTTPARLRRERKKLPNRIFCSYAKRMKKQPGTAGINPIPKPTSKTASQMCRQPKSVSVLEAVARRTPTKINSFKYFVKEITAQPDPRNRAWQKKRLEKIVHKIRDISVGRADYSMADFVEDVKCSCAREGDCVRKRSV